MINKRISINKWLLIPRLGFVLCLKQNGRICLIDMFMVYEMSQILDGIKLIQRGNQGVF
jgi:hypothetical protein